MKRPVKKQSNMKITTYEKSFESFTEMIDELKTLHPEMQNIFIYNDEEVNPVDSASDVLEYFSKNTPNIITGKNLPVSLSISANNILLKTAKYFSIKWKFKYDKDGNISDIYSNVTVFDREDKNSEEINTMIELLQNNGWTVKENK